MINSIPISHPYPQNPGISGSSCPSDCHMMEVEEEGGEKPSHTRTVQALRKYLQRKLSSEDSSSERESHSPQETEQGYINRSFETNEEPKSTLTINKITLPSGRNIFPLQKQRSLDDYSPSLPHSFTLFSSAQKIFDHRYLRTDLCVPVLLSRCTFCDFSAELDEDLRAHMREKHWRYFFDNPTIPFPEAQAAPEALDLSMRKSTEVTGSLPNLSLMKSLSSNSLLGVGFGTDGNGGIKGIKKQVKCLTCGKSFSTKWNWKQHQKIHLRENLQTYQQ